MAENGECQGQSRSRLTSESHMHGPKADFSISQQDSVDVIDIRT